MSKMTYFEMAKEAIAVQKERSGSSSQAIKSYITANHKEINFQQHLLRKRPFDIQYVYM
jgi:hypothetical protein